MSSGKDTHSESNRRAKIGFWMFLSLCFTIAVFLLETDGVTGSWRTIIIFNLLFWCMMDFTFEIRNPENLLIRIQGGNWNISQLNSITQNKVSYRFYTYGVTNSGSQRPRGLRHVLSSVAWTLESQVRILTGAWMCPRFFYVVLSCVGRGLASGWSPVQGVLPTVQIDS
jgi:hypothetical protein